MQKNSSDANAQTQDEPTKSSSHISPPSRAVPALDPMLLTRDRELQDHLRSLSLNTLEEYAAWCHENGFSTVIKKNWKQRCKEKYHVSKALINERRKKLKQEKRRPLEVISQSVSSKPPQLRKVQPRKVAVEIAVENAPASDWAKRIFEIASKADDQTRTAFEKILYRLQKTHSPMLRSDLGHRLGDGGSPFFPGLVYPYMEDDRNTYLQALATISMYDRQWIRSLDDWSPNTKNIAKQFSSLCRHLLAKYPTPTFMDCVWFGNDPLTRQPEHSWFIGLANGTSVRKLGLPIPLSKKMVNHFMQTPNGLNVMAGIRRAQILGVGGCDSLLRGVLATRLATTTVANEFWLSVIRWLVKHPMLHPITFGPLVDFINYEKFGRAGEAELETGYRLEGRSPESVLRSMHLWHAGLRQVKDLEDNGWDHHPDIAEFKHSDSDTTWSINQLLSTNALLEEGRQLRHCVLSYARECLSDSTTIWSMSVFRRNSSRPRKVLTIEVAPVTRKIRQVRGRGNRRPRPKELAVIRRWASEQRLKMRT